MDEWVMERYELAKERIAQIPDEKMAEEPYCDFFTKEAMFLQQVIHVMDHGIAGKNLEELQEQNHELYQDILPENYENSYGNPAYAQKTVTEKADYVIEQIADIVKVTNIPTDLTQYGVTMDDLEFLVTAGSQQQRLLVNNMKELSLDDIRNIYLKVVK